MNDKAEYYIVRRRAVPEVLRGVVRANQLLASGKARTVNEAAEIAGISRSSYYKFKDDIEEFHDNTAGMNVTLSCEIDDEPGILAGLLGVISRCNANILTIHQSIPAGWHHCGNSPDQCTGTCSGPDGCIQKRKRRRRGSSDHSAMEREPRCQLQAGNTIQETVEKNPVAKKLHQSMKSRVVFGVKLSQYSF